MLSFYFLSQRKTTSRKINITQSDVPRAAGWSVPSASRASFLLGAARPWLRASCATRPGPLPASPFLLEAHPEQLEMDRFRIQSSSRIGNISTFSASNFVPYTGGGLYFDIFKFTSHSVFNDKCLIGIHYSQYFSAIHNRWLLVVKILCYWHTTQTQVTLKWRVFYFSIERTGEGQL